LFWIGAEKREESGPEEGGPNQLEMSADQLPTTGWYPVPPAQELEAIGVDFQAQAQAQGQSTTPSLHKPHCIWGKKRYLQQNDWSKVRREERERVRRLHLHGVEVRDLPPSHKLHGEQGLFATRKWLQFDVLGEYTGLIVGRDCYGHYVASLEDCSDHDSSLGIDAETCGNELRFINSHIGIAFSPNVTMRTVYVNTLPHIVLVCTTDIEVGEEFLLDYGASYNAAYLTGEPKTISVTMSDEASILAWSALPGGGSDSDSDSDSNH